MSIGAVRVPSLREPNCNGREDGTLPTARFARREARAGGIDNISLDLMMWLPQQSRSDWRDSVATLIAVGPAHASLYLL